MQRKTSRKVKLNETEILCDVHILLFNFVFTKQLDNVMDSTRCKQKILRKKGSWNTKTNVCMKRNETK